jgi:hypothetical protein
MTTKVYSKTLTDKYSEETLSKGFSITPHIIMDNVVGLKINPTDFTIYCVIQRFYKEQFLTDELIHQKCGVSIRRIKEFRKNFRTLGYVELKYKSATNKDGKTFRLGTSYNFEQLEQKAYNISLAQSAESAPCENTQSAEKCSPGAEKCSPGAESARTYNKIVYKDSSKRDDFFIDIPKDDKSTNTESANNELKETSDFLELKKANLNERSQVSNKLTIDQVKHVVHKHNPLFRRNSDDVESFQEITKRLNKQVFPYNNLLRYITEINGDIYPSKLLKAIPAKTFFETVKEEYNIDPTPEQLQEHESQFNFISESEFKEFFI